MFYMLKEMQIMKKIYIYSAEKMGLMLLALCEATAESINFVIRV